jgi:hypothetical protein
LLLTSVTFAQLPAPAAVAATSEAEVERVIVTGSNIPTAEETGPDPVDTYRPADIEKPFVCRFGLLWFLILRNHFWPFTGVLQEIR